MQLISLHVAHGLFCRRTGCILSKCSVLEQCFSQVLASTFKHDVFGITRDTEVLDFNKRTKARTEAPEMYQSLSVDDRALLALARLLSLYVGDTTQEGLALFALFGQSSFRGGDNVSGSFV